MLPQMPKVDLGRPATHDDLVAVPDHLVAEIVGDELWTSPRPAPRQAAAYSALGALLLSAFRFGQGGPGGWVILDEPELHLGRHVVVPDIAGWRQARMPSLPETPYFSVAPDWICEVLSPSTVALDRARKLQVYAEAGVLHAWLVDPLARTLEVLRREPSGLWALLDVHGGNVAVRAEPFEAVEVNLALVWAE